MELFTLCSVLLLPMSLCSDPDSEGTGDFISSNLSTLVKTIGGELDVTPICTNSTHNIITLIICKIRTERNGSEECRLLYRYGQDFTQDCGSRFTLTTTDQTVFLHLTGLKPVDSGSHTCECSHLDGTFILHLNITVEEDEDTNSSTIIPQMRFPAPLIDHRMIVIILTGIIGLTTVVITGVILEIFYRAKRNGGCSRSATAGLSQRETPGALAADDPDDPYMSLQQSTSDLYQTISNPASNIVTVHLENLKKGGRESHPSCTVYENI